MKEYCLWKDEEVKNLFDFIKQCNTQGKSLTVAFKEYALNSGRQPNSVRNYYYLELNNLLNNPQRVKNLNIDLSLHQKKETRFFTEEETEKQMKQLMELINKGYSVRKACLTVGNGNLEMMVRLQNKYRSILKTNPEYLENFAQNKSNIIPMPQRKNKLSDNEINSLFIGLVKLIKNQAKQEANIIIKNEKEQANNLLRQTMVEIANKDKQIATLRKQLQLLKNESKTMTSKIEQLRSESAKLNIYNKNEKLKKWAQSKRTKRKVQ